MDRLKATRDALARQALIQVDPNGVLQAQIVAIDGVLVQLGKRFEDLGGQAGAGAFAVAAEQAKRVAQIAEQANQDQLASTRTTLQLRQQALEAALAQDLITRQQFAAGAIAITQQQSAAEVVALRAERTAALVRPTANAGSSSSGMRKSRTSPGSSTSKASNSAWSSNGSGTSSNLPTSPCCRRRGSVSPPTRRHGRGSEPRRPDHAEAPLDLREVQADVEAFARTTQQIKLDEAFERARKTARHSQSCSQRSA